MECNGKEIEVLPKTEVLVAGSGPAGIAAAVAAGRRGAKVTLIEQAGVVGGVSTAGLMSHFVGRIESDLYDEMLERQRILTARKKDDWREMINPDALEVVYLEMLEEARVTVRLYTLLVDTLVEDGTVTGVLLADKKGLRVLPCDVLVDCTGDGDAAAKAGAQFVLGRESDGKMQPATLMFKVGGVDYARAVFPCSFETTVETAKGELQALARQKMTHPLGHVLLYRTDLSGVVTVNMTNVTDIDGTVPEDLTRADIACRKQMFEVVDFLRAYAPGYENCFVVSSASLIGIRETRHIVGEKRLEREDIEAARQFDDWAARGAHFNFDVHNITGAGLDKTGVQAKFRQNDGYTIPYGCLIPKGLNNVLLGGRCISGSHIAHSSYRAMPICFGTGEAAGVAATLALACGNRVRDVDIRRLQNALLGK